MPLVHIQMAEGRTAEQKRAVMAAMTDAMVEHLGATRDSVRVWITEFPDTDFMAAGEVLADKRARIAARPDDRASRQGSDPGRNTQS